MSVKYQEHILTHVQAKDFNSNVKWAMREYESLNMVSILDWGALSTCLHALKEVGDIAIQDWIEKFI